MKKGLVIVATIAGVILLGNVLIAAAQDESPGYGWRAGSGMMRGRGWMHDGLFGPGAMHEEVWTAIASELGMTYDELVAAVQDGQTIAEIAEERGVPLAGVKAAALEAHEAALAGLVEQGAITQEQADWMLSRMESRLDYMLQSGPGGCHGGGPGGMMNGWRGGPRWNPPGSNNS